jgi:hypothetical protein
LNPSRTMFGPLLFIPEETPNFSQRWYQRRKVKQHLLCCLLWNHYLVKGTLCWWTIACKTEIYENWLCWELCMNRKGVPKIVKEKTEERGNYRSAFWPSVSSEMVWQKNVRQNVKKVTQCHSSQLEGYLQSNFTRETNWSLEVQNWHGSGFTTWRCCWKKSARVM